MGFHSPQPEFGLIQLSLNVSQAISRGQNRSELRGDRL